MVIFNESPAVMESLEVFGILEIASSPSKSFTVESKYIYVSGRFIAGTEEQPYEGELDIVLDGDQDTPDFDIVNLSEGRSGVEMGAKSMGENF